MIYIYTGKIGDGKSYHVVRNELLPAVRAGRDVYTNLDIGPEHIRAIAFECGLEPSAVKIHIVEGKRVKDILKLDENDKEGKHFLVPHKSLIILDEAQQFYRAREFKETPREFLFLLEWHRHLGLDIVFITQDVGQMDKAIGRLCNEFLTVKNLKMLHGLFGSRYVLQHREKPGLPVLATTRGELDPKYFRFYRSMVTEGRGTHKTVAGLSLWKVGAVAALLCIAGFRVATQGAFGGAVKSARRAEESVRPVVAVPGRSAPSIDSMPSGVVGVDLRDSVGPRRENCRQEFVTGRARIVFQGREERQEFPRLVTTCEAVASVPDRPRSPFLRPLTN